ncbi:MAG: hypothetical protein FAF03_11860 [Epsilonproteobacteria bacterium]|nr:hypothetical protein [Campylobacterota bacterium]
MKRSKIITMASALFILSLVFAYIGYSFGQNIFERDMIIMFGVTFVFILWAISAKPEPTEWTCQKCQAKLLRKQIKFGLCPHCGTKIKDFRGESPYSWI